MWEEYEPDRSYRRKRRYKKRRFLRRCLGLFLIILVILTGMRVKGKDSQEAAVLPCQYLRTGR